MCSSRRTCFISSARFSAAPGAGGRLPADREGLPEDVACQIHSHFQGKRHIPFLATDHEIGHGRDITWTLRAKRAPVPIREGWISTSWIVEVTASGTHDGRHFQATHVFLTSLRTKPEALLQLVSDCWSMRAGTGSVTPSSMRMPTATGAMLTT